MNEIHIIDYKINGKTHSVRVWAHSKEEAIQNLKIAAETGEYLGVWVSDS